MRILDENGIELINPDLTLGHLEEEEILVAHHEAVEAVEEQGHYEVVVEYPETGGKDVEWVVDVPGVEAREEWDEYESILRYILYTEEELAEIYPDHPSLEPEQPEPPSGDSVWDELDAAYQAGYDEGYKEGVNGAYVNE